MKITISQYGQILGEILEMEDEKSRAKALDVLARLIIRNKDQKKFSHIIAAKEKLSNQKNQLIQGEVFLSRRSEIEVKSLLAEIIAKKEQELGGKIQLTFREDPSLLGGMKLKIFDEVWDASWKKKISRLGEFLKNEG